MSQNLLLMDNITTNNEYNKQKDNLKRLQENNPQICAIMQKLYNSTLVKIVIAFDMIPRANAAISIDIANYAISQLGANAVVLAFGVLAGSGEPVEYDDAYAAGPLLAVNRSVGLIRKRRNTNIRASQYGKYIIIGQAPSAMQGALNKIRHLFLPAVINMMVWGWAASTGSAPGWLTSIALGYSSFEIISRGVLAILADWLVKDQLIGLCDNDDLRDVVTITPDSPLFNEFQTQSHIKSQLRDYPIVIREGSIHLQASGNAKKVKLKDKLLGNYIYAVIKQQGRPNVFLILHILLDTILVIWWLALMSGPAITPSSWWPAIFSFIIASVQKAACVEISVQWMRGMPKEFSSDLSADHIVMNYMGEILVEEIKLWATAGSLFVAAKTNKRLSTGWVEGRAFSVHGVDHTKLMDVWVHLLSIDKEYNNWLAGVPQEKELQETGARVLYLNLAEVVRRVIKLGEHMMICTRHDRTMSAKGFKSEDSTRMLLAIFGAIHPCSETMEDTQWLEDWISKNWWVISCIGEKVGPLGISSNEMFTALSGEGFRSILRRVLNACLFPHASLTLAQLIILMINWWSTNKNSMFSIGPHMAAYRLWIDALKADVETLGTAIIIRTFGHMYTIETNESLMNNFIPLSTDEGPYTTNLAVKLLHDKLANARRKFGLSTDIVMGTQTNGIYEWMTAQEKAIGSANRTAEESREFRKSYRKSKNHQINGKERPLN